MRISLLEAGLDEATRIVDVDWGQLALHITSKNWSPQTFFQDNTGRMARLNDNFQSTDFMVLDIDDGMTIEEAKIAFKEYACVLAPTKSHQKEKTTPSGKVKPACDRYRIIIPLERTVTDKVEFKATWFAAKDIWPFMDDACKDFARFYFPSTGILAAWLGRSFPVSNELPEHLDEYNQAGKLMSINTSGPKGELYISTKNFLAMGAPAGQWHHKFISAAMNMKGCGYSFEEAKTLLTKATIGYAGQLDDTDITQLKDVYEKRSVQDQTGYQPVGENTMANIPQQTYQQPARPAAQVKVDKSKLSSSTIKSALRKDRENRKIAKSREMPFICDAFDDTYSLTSGFVLVGGQSGKGKSTSVSNIIYGLLKSLNGRKIRVISNEESTEDVLTRVACLMFELNWADYRAENLSQETDDKVFALAEQLAEVIEVFSLTDESGMDFSYMEDLQLVLEDTGECIDQYAAVLFDYWQTTTQSKNNPQLSSVDVSKQLGLYCKEFAGSIPVPFIAFTQLKTKDQARDIKDRIENDRTLYNHAQDVVEIDADIENKRTTFTFHKHRWGMEQGAKVTTQWRAGKYETIVEEEVG